MSLKDEIAALREEIDRRLRAEPEAPISAPADGRNGAEGNEGIDAILASARSAVDELGHDIDKFPRLSAITAFGVGLTLGIALGRQAR
jgi:hypothetical protein